MKKMNLALILFITLLMSSCGQNNNDDQTTVPEKESSSIINHKKSIINNRKEVDKIYNKVLSPNNENIVNNDNNITDNQPVINNEKNNDRTNKIVNSVSNKIKDEKPIIKDNPKPPKENIKPDNPTEQAPPIKEEPIVTPPKEETVKKLCENAWYDEFKDCDYIPDNLKPVDELGRSVPLFNTSQEAWNWGENEIENNTSNYGCRGFTRMDGHYNNGKQFFFAYLKVCDN